ncbi:MAG: hypothetical protein FWD54_00960 [Endomicrobia bacterium]|nr:hypothetical protein [Endomicrobiia bacterium]MCL2798842.1 hypothetical protein [Endomicrobiia bacterium]
MKKILFALLVFLIFSAFCFSIDLDLELRRVYNSPVKIYYSFGSNFRLTRPSWPMPLRAANTAYFQKDTAADLDRLYSLEARRSAAESRDRILSLIIVLNAKIYTIDNGQTKAEITVENNSGFTIKKIYFTGEITSRATGEIIAAKAFNYTLSKPLLPLNKKTYEILMNNIFPVSCSDMCGFEVKVTGIYTESGQAIQTGAFTQAEEQKLNILRDNLR